MKHLLNILTLFAALSLTSQVCCHAQQSSDVQSTMDQILKKHEGVRGVTSMKVAKGSGLNMVKMMFNDEFGKDFMKGVTSITIIEYSDASEETCMALRKDLDVFLALLQEFDLSEETKFADEEYVRCFASVSDSDTLSDFVIAMENDDSKMIMYMAGKINIE